eukprot:gene7855-9220_t
MTADKGGVECTSLSADQVWAIAHHSRLAESMRARLGQPFRAHNWGMLKTGLTSLPWNDFYVVRDHTLPQVSVTCAASTLYHSGAVEERIHEHFQKHVIKVKKLVSGTPSGHSRLFVRINDEQAQLSVDAVGDDHPLHKRTPDKHVTDAPIRETLAAAMLSLARLDRGQPVAIWDPFMGSGTIVQEALGMARGGPATPPSRQFSFESWPSMREDRYATYLERISTVPLNPLDDSIFFGSDIDRRAIDASIHNLTGAGYDPVPLTEDGPSSALQLRTGHFELIEPIIQKRIDAGLARPLTIVSNLPYGGRMMAGESHHQISNSLAATFTSFGKMLQESRAISSAYVLNGHPRFHDLTGVKWDTIAKFKNGGLAVEFLKYSKKQ